MQTQQDEFRPMAKGLSSRRRQHSECKRKEISSSSEVKSMIYKVLILFFSIFMTDFENHGSFWALGRAYRVYI